MNNAPHITKDVFAQILQDDSLMHRDCLRIFQTLYSLEKQEASATELARIIGWKNKAEVTGRIVGLGKRVHKKLGILQRKRKDDSNSYWDFFFTGYQQGNYFIYQLKPELREAMEECGLTDSVLSIRTAFLFSWNPELWEWKDIQEKVEALEQEGKAMQAWTCQSYKRMRPGDRAFFVRLGSEPRGIFASGRIVSAPYPTQHSEDVDTTQHSVMIEFDYLLNPTLDPILSIERLTSAIVSQQNWTPEASGIAIRPEVVDELEEEWFEFLRSNHLLYDTADESSTGTKTFVEGAAVQVLQTRYERNVYARKACLSYYGYTCSVCGLNFEKTYGDIGYQFIHVHHLTQVSEIKQEYRVNPVQDLRPVCPNCHAMLHRRTPPFTIEELRNKLQQHPGED